MSMGTWTEKLFHLRENNTTAKTEILAGLTTFVAMAYIIFVNPAILSESGMPKEAAFAATIWATALATAIMGIYANYPIAIAPGMGFNAFFTYTIVRQFGMSWQAALGAVFISGVIFLLLTFGKIRQAMINAVSYNLKIAVGVGFGLFIAFIGLQESGIVVSDPVTLVNIGKIGGLDIYGNPSGQFPLLTCIGVIFTGVLMARGFRGSILIGVIFTTLLGMALGIVQTPTTWDAVVSFNFPSIFGELGTFAKLDIAAVFNYGIFGVIFTFTVMQLLDNMGSLIGLTRRIGLINPEGTIKNIQPALTSDAVGTITGAVIGTSPMVSYVENAAGIAEGGRTGLTAIIVALLFVAALIFAPLVSLVPFFATAPALIIVGALMITDVTQLRFDDITETLPAFFTIVMMPLTYSIANGFAFGFTSYTLLKLFTGRARELNLMTYIITAALMLNFYYRLH